MITGAHAAGKKAFLTIGGAGTYSNFTAALSTSSTRLALVSALLAHIDTHYYDGIDVDYEPLHDADIPNLLSFLDAIKAARPQLVIAICSGQFNANSQSFYISQTNLAAIGQRVDIINLMTYGMAYNFSGWQSWHSSPLYGHGTTTPMDIEFDVSRCLSAGIAERKIGIGVGTFGCGFTGCTAPKQDFTAFVGADETFKYHVIVNNYLPNMTRVWDVTAKVPYLWSNTAVGSPAVNYLSYDDPESIAAKAQYIKTRGIGGMIMWHVAQQYFPAAPGDAKHPLLVAVQDTLL